MSRLLVGDEVIVTRGNDKGKRGRVRRILKDKGRVVVEGVHVVKRHVKPTAQRAGGILEVEAPIAESNVMLLDPATQKPTRVKVKVEAGKKLRVAKSGATIPTPAR